VRNVQTGSRRTIKDAASVHVLDSLLPNTSYEITSTYVVRGVSGPSSVPTTFRTKEDPSTGNGKILFRTLAAALISCCEFCRWNVGKNFAPKKKSHQWEWVHCCCKKCCCKNYRVSISVSIPFLILYTPLLYH